MGAANSWHSNPTRCRDKKKLGRHSSFPSGRWATTLSTCPQLPWTEMWGIPGPGRWAQDLTAGTPGDPVKRAAQGPATTPFVCSGGTLSLHCASLSQLSVLYFPVFLHFSWGHDFKFKREALLKFLRSSTCNCTSLRICIQTAGKSQGQPLEFSTVKAYQRKLLRLRLNLNVISSQPWRNKPRY